MHKPVDLLLLVSSHISSKRLHVMFPTKLIIDIRKYQNALSSVSINDKDLFPRWIHVSSMNMEHHFNNRKSTNQSASHQILNASMINFVFPENNFHKIDVTLQSTEVRISHHILRTVWFRQQVGRWASRDSHNEYMHMAHLQYNTKSEDWQICCKKTLIDIQKCGFEVWLTVDWLSVGLCLLSNDDNSKFPQYFIRCRQVQIIIFSLPLMKFREWDAREKEK